MTFNTFCQLDNRTFCIYSINNAFHDRSFGISGNIGPKRILLSLFNPQ